MRRLRSKALLIAATLAVITTLCAAAASALDDVSDEDLAQILGYSTKFPCCGRRVGVYCTGVTKQCIEEGDQCVSHSPVEKWGCMDKHPDLGSWCTVEGFQMSCFMKRYCGHGEYPYPDCPEGEHVCGCTGEVIPSTQKYWACLGTDCPEYEASARPSRRPGVLEEDARPSRYSRVASAAALHRRGER